HGGLAEQGLDDGGAKPGGQLYHLVAAAQAAAAGHDGDFGAAVEDLGGFGEALLGGQRMDGGVEVGAVVGDVGVGALIHVEAPLLHVFGDGDVAHAVTAEGGLDGGVDHVDDVGGSHDALVVDGDIHVELVEVHILLVAGADEVVEGVAGDGEHGLAVALGVVEAVEEVDAAGAGGGEANAEAARVLGVAAG